jgi:hypothetical protein
MFATSGKAGMHQQLAIQRFGKSWQSIAQSCSETFFARLAKYLAIDFLV